MSVCVRSCVCVCGFVCAQKGLFCLLCVFVESIAVRVLSYAHMAVLFACVGSCGGLGVCGGVVHFRGGLVAGSGPDCFYMFVFWLKCPLKAMK